MVAINGEQQVSATLQKQKQNNKGGLYKWLKRKKEIVAAVEVDWDEYFESIKAVCPWSLRAWRQNQIEIIKWHSQQIKELGLIEARLYISNHNPRQLKKITKKLNSLRPKEEWLWSHPSYGNHSSHVPVLIQQDRDKLSSIRSKIGFLTEND